MYAKAMENHVPEPTRFIRCSRGRLTRAAGCACSGGAGRELSGVRCGVVAGRAEARRLTRNLRQRAFAASTRRTPKCCGLPRASRNIISRSAIYLKSRVTAGSALRWQDATPRNGPTRWTAVEAKYGVDKNIIVAIWGLETGYGGFSGGKDVIRSLATLAQARYRDDFFRNELLAALEILEQEHITREKMRGSWAGAMGQAQFIPSSFLKFAVDFSGDGRRDIWSDVPDVLGSIANYMKETRLAARRTVGFRSLACRKISIIAKAARRFPEWQELGIRRADGRALPKSGNGILFFPSGAEGPAFLVTSNYETIKRYNLSDAYSLTVAGTADRLRGSRASAASGRNRFRSTATSASACRS